MGSSACLSLETLSAFLDGELPELERQAALRHLGSCGRCSAELASFGRLDAVLAAPPTIACATALPFLSARHDRELTLAEGLAAESHAAHCSSCRAQAASWNRIDAAITALPPAIPSRRVDTAVLALGAAPNGPRTGSAGRGLVTGVALRAGVAVGLVIAVAFAAIQEPEAQRTQTQTEPQPQPAAQQAIPPLPPIGATQAIVASAQQTLINPRTNTLYVAHPDEGTVGALNATSLANVATINVGGRPTALALNDTANTVLVLDTSQKTITEIDGATNNVLGTTVLGIAGTPTALQFDPTSGRIVVTSVATPQPQQSSSSGAVALLDGSSKKLEATETVSVAPRLVVLDHQGKRSLLVSEDVVTVVDATTYQRLDQLPGGVAAVFSARGDSTAVLSAVSGGARLSIAGLQNASITFIGSPVALIALPQGGYAALLVDAGHGRIVEVGADGSPGAMASVDLVGRDLSYNGATHVYTVASEKGVAFASTSGAVAVPSPAGPSNAQVPGGSGATAVKPSSAPSSGSQVAVNAPKTTERQANVPEGARLAWQGMYRFDLIGRGSPTVLGRGRAGHLWFVDSENRLTSLDADTGQTYTIAELPGDARIRSIEVGTSHVYAIDVAASRVYVVALPSETVTPIKLPFVKSSAAVTVTPDDHLWFAVADQILTLDPATGLVEAANVGLYSVGAMAADSAGRVWFTDEVHDKIGLYDRRSHGVTDFVLPRKGAVTSMVVDGSGTLWAGTDAGELFAIQGGILGQSTLLARPVVELALDAQGRAWYLSGDAAQKTVGQVQGRASLQAVPGSVVGLWFDAKSHAWLPDRASSGFYISVSEAR